jgi:spore coat protein CotF
LIQTLEINQAQLFPEPMIEIVPSKQNPEDIINQASSPTFILQKKSGVVRLSKNMGLTSHFAQAMGLQAFLNQ